jgi:hypothetical protein
MILATRHAAGIIVLWCRPEHEQASSRKVIRGNCGHWISHSVNVDDRMKAAAESIVEIFDENIALALVDRLTKSMCGSANSILQDELRVREIVEGVQMLRVQVCVRLHVPTPMLMHYRTTHNQDMPRLHLTMSLRQAPIRLFTRHSLRSTQVLDVGRRHPP